MEYEYILAHGGLTVEEAGYLYSREELDAMSDNELKHIGVKRRSGRYPWGSGEDAYQRENRDFIGRVEQLRKENFEYTDETGKTWKGDTAIAKSMGLTSTQFRIELGLANDERRMLNVARAKSLREDGLGATEIGREMGVSESTVRSWFNEKSEARMLEAQKTADFLKQRVNETKMLDVGVGVERELNISKEKLKEALYLLEREGYGVYNGRIPQATNQGQFTTQKVLCVPDIQPKGDAKAPSEIYQFDKIGTVRDYISRDGGTTYEKKFNYPESMDSSRMMVRYKEDGGIDKDGIVELRRGVADLDLGESRYSQVRILVDGTHYIKGMAVYSDDMPDGVDVVFNTNKTKDKPLTEVLKKIKDDPDNPFGSAIKDADKGGQYWYDADTGKRCSANDPNVKNKKLGLINKRADEGDWTEWADALPSQFLGKQSQAMAKKQLGLAKADKLAEFDEICSLNNPTVKKHLLEKFASQCDSAAVDLKAAALPGQKYHVIIPINTLKDNEVYAPRYEDGTKLALIRYPHGGTFEIPILTVNNKNELGRQILGTDAGDGVGITSKVAERLSGADFDGDTVMCIPTHDKGGRVKIASTPPLQGLEGFDPKMEYPERQGMKYMKDPVTGKDSTQMEMGKISNLITDMTLAGATEDELARAVRHSMVVIDAGKHKLDYRQSAADNRIEELKKKYQPKFDKDGNPTGKGGGASTLLSRSKGEYQVDKRQGSAKINSKYKSNGELNPDYDPTRPEGANLWKPADDLYYEVSKTNKRTGETTTITKTKHQKSTNMAETDDPYSLVSNARHPMELIYADYASSMKSLANQARLEKVKTGKIAYSKEAKAKYAEEVASLNAKLNDALLNTGRERAAQRMAAAEVIDKKANNPDWKNKDIKKANQQAISKYRSELGSVSRRDRSIKITDKEWEAIQEGAISESQLIKILNNTDISDLRQRATPRATNTLSEAKINRIKAMNNSNYTLGQIATKLGVSTSTVSNYLKGAS